MNPVGINRWTLPGKWTLAECFMQVQEAGFDCLELNLEESGPVHRSMSEKEAGEVRDAADKAGIHLYSLSCGLGWKYPMTSPDLEVRSEGKKVVRDLLQKARWLGADTVLVVPGVVNTEISYDAAYARTKEALLELADDAAAEQVHIGLENVWNKFLLSPLEFAALLDEVGSPWIGAYFDVGNVLAFGYPEQWIRILGARICKVHVKDFKTGIGNISGFCNPLQGDVNWKAVSDALQAAGYTGPVTAEVEGYRVNQPLGLRHIAESLRSVFQ